MTTSLDATCSAIVAGLKASGLNLLAIDFDQTIVNIHTGGRWAGPLDELAGRIRPFFSKFIPLAVKEGVHVAVVTFSPQVNVIAGVLKHAFSEGVASKIPIRGNDNSWTYEGRGSRDGKQAHMASAAEEIGLKHNVEITRNTVILIDDDRNNIESALRNEVRAIWLDPDNPERVVSNLCELLGIAT